MTTVADQANHSLDPVVETFLSQPPAIVRGGLVLSLSVAVSPTQLRSLVHTIWPDTTLTDAEVGELLDWPFVLAGELGWSILPAIAKLLSSYFHETDQGHFTTAHELLASMESNRTPVDQLDEWFIRGRTAYYLAGVDPALSSIQFGEVFERAPVVDRTSCRVWLAGNQSL